MKSREDNIIGFFSSLIERLKYLTRNMSEATISLIYLLKQGIWGMIHPLKLKMQSDETMVY